MGFSIYSIFKAGLLLLNAITILHPRRLLAHCEFHSLQCSFFVDGLDQVDPVAGQSLKNQIAGLIQAASYLKGLIYIYEFNLP
jgi:hypothetical protein